jgi:hypothetical protein
VTTKTYDEKCYDLAAVFLGDHPHLHQERRIAELAQQVQRTIDGYIEDAERNYDGAPYCSYGHKTKESCDCGPIASNE